MAGRTVTRADLSEAVRQKLGLSWAGSAELVGQVLTEICDRLAQGDPMKLSGFGAFVVRHKGERVGRNPRTGVEAPIEARQAITFKPSDVLRARINGGSRKPGSG